MVNLMEISYRMYVLVCSNIVQFLYFSITAES